MTIYNSRGNQINIAQIAIFTIILQLKSNQIKCWFLMRGENQSTRRKTSHSRVENQQTQSTYDAECGNRPQATFVEGKCSHHQANPATSRWQGWPSGLVAWWPVIWMTTEGTGINFDSKENYPLKPYAVIRAENTCSVRGIPASFMNSRTLLQK